MTAPVDLERLEKTTAGDAAVERELIEIFISQTDDQLTRLKKSLAEVDHAQLREHAHAIKGASANVGADRLRALATELELAMKNGETEKADGLVEEVGSEYARVRAFLDAHTTRG